MTFWPKNCQAPNVSTVSNASRGLDRKSGCGSPAARSPLLSRPNCGEAMDCQISAVATAGRVSGMMNGARNHPAPGVRVLSASAIPSPAAMVSSTKPAV